MNWGKWIVVSFVFFAAFIGVLVMICIRQDVSLVANDYYKQELEFQQQIDRNHNTQELAIKPDISIISNRVQVSFQNFQNIQKGELKLFRPSNEQYDLTFQLKSTSDTVQYFDLASRQRGMYKARMKWSMNDKEYYLEKIVYL